MNADDVQLPTSINYPTRHWRDQDYIYVAVEFILKEYAGLAQRTQYYITAVCVRFNQ